MKEKKGTIEKCEKNNQLPKMGVKVKIKNKIAGKKICMGFFVKDKYINCRRTDEVGTYRGWVPGAGGDVWWIEHMDGTIGAYLFDELTDI